MYNNISPFVELFFYTIGFWLLLDSLVRGFFILRGKDVLFLPFEIANKIADATRGSDFARRNREILAKQRFWKFTAIAIFITGPCAFVEIIKGIINAIRKISM